MRAHHLGLRVVVVALVALVLAAGCSSDRRSNSAQSLLGARATAEGLSLTATPAHIVIDPTNPATPTDPAHNNEHYGTAILAAVATDVNGVPQDSLVVMFQSSDGRLISGGAAMMTDTLGRAGDTLRVYTSDPDSITVGVTDGTRLTTIVVHKQVIGPPVANAGPDQTVQCNADSAAQVHLDGSASADPDSNITSYQWFEFYGSAQQALLGTGVTTDVMLPLGSHVITLLVTDASGSTDTDTLVVTVEDTAPPVVTLTFTPKELWPPNHKMAHVTAHLNVLDCSPVTVTLESVTSNEPDNGLGDGDTENDIQGVETGTADFDFDLRAERSGGGHGRVYTVVYRIVDASGVESFARGWVKVPHDKGGK